MYYARALGGALNTKHFTLCHAPLMIVLIRARRLVICKYQAVSSRLSSNQAKFPHKGTMFGAISSLRCRLPTVQVRKELLSFNIQ
jgi:hypothetical protein